MGSGRRTCLLWLLAFLAFSSLTSLVDGTQLNVMSAPNLLRVGTAENIFVEIQDFGGTNDVQVEIRVLSFPTKVTEYKKISVTLNATASFQALGRITIPPAKFSQEETQFVYLQARFPDETLEKIVLVSFQAGYIFIQTDKTLYTPKSNVDYRVFAVTPGMEPVDKGTSTDDTISIEVKTPEGLIAKSSLTSVKSGILSGSHRLGGIVSYGMWKLEAKFSSNPQQSFTAAFEVKEYVLPSFEVKLEPESPFYYTDSEELTVNIKATYLFGKKVNGMAYVVFGVVFQSREKKGFPDSLQRVQITEGTGQVKLKKEHIKNIYSNILDLVGNSIYVSVSVLTEDGGEMVEAQYKGIKIVTSPYTIRFTKTPKYFKQGMAFDIAVEVVNPDGSPAKGVRVVATPGPSPGRTAANGIARLSVNPQNSKQLTVQVTTEDSRIGADRQASATMVAVAHTTTNNNFIHIGVDTAELENGQNLKVLLSVNKQEREFDVTLLILSRGQLVTCKRQSINRQTQIAVTLIVTKEMLPSFRIIAYYHTSAKEVVSDSVRLDVKISCMGSLKLEPTIPAPSFEPTSPFELKVTGDPGAKVGLVAVDKGVHVLNNKHYLTQKKVWDTVEKYDTGCTPGGGKDSMGVFYDAGLMFKSSASETPVREAHNCPVPSRRKRATTITEARTSLASQYKNDLQRECCLDGMKDIPLSYTCQRRSEYIQDGQACRDAFLQCCNEMTVVRANRKVEELQLARSEEEDGYIDSVDIVTRTNFPESWLFTVIDLPPCSDPSRGCETTSAVKHDLLKDSITTWLFTGISLSRTHGVCVSDPLEVIVWKRFFIDLKVPYSAVLGEQVEIKAILHNYRTQPSTVRVDLFEESHLCSAAYKRVKFRQEVEVGAESTRSVPFVIIPMEPGEWEIKVHAAVRGGELSDGIMKKLRVVPRGILTKKYTTVTLDPARRGGTQRELINSQIDPKDIAPGVKPHAEVSLTGREQMNALLDNAISGKSLGTLIQAPSGCGEQNMIGMTLPVTAAMYLDRTDQWKAVGVSKRPEAIQHIQTGYQNQLAFRKSDGSFAMYQFYPSTTWLTAYVAKVFSMADHLVGGQRSVICDAVKFLILNTQQPDGMFTEIGDVYMKSMISDVQGVDSDASMTAFCLIAMQESRSKCPDIDSLPHTINKAVNYLETRLPSVTNPYAVAMTSYALANENKLNKDILFKFSSSGTHWETILGDIYTLEATAYALLALVKTKAIAEAKPIVEWLKQQQRWGGGYGSTQATIMVYQAVAEYWANSPEPEYSLDVDLRLPGRQLDIRYHFNSKTLDTKSNKFNDINTNVSLTAKGNGSATFTMVSLYYILPESMESDCQRFNLSIDVKPEKMDDAENIYKLTIRILSKDRTALMPIVDVGLPTGFVPNKDDLNLLSKGHARTISKFEMDQALSERGSLIIYLNKISHIQEEEIAFRIHQKLKGNILQPAAVSVYEYYDRKPCVKFYNPQRRGGGTMRSCGNEDCTCADETCSLQKKESIKDADRTAKACEHTRTSQIDFVYKIRVDEIREDLSRDVYKVTILESIKEGSFDKGVNGLTRTFFSFPHCRSSLDLAEHKTYLVMGTSKDIYKDEKTQSYQYSFGERTWLEYWPTEAEGQTDKYRTAYLGMEELKNVYLIFGCEL
ncbi:complement C3-like [Centropristis striata]|uniref:complement C3-like n=1 Tax=Centropristis striata TaxID=184440 RepID=UPI0027E17A06|nr:complement C3-like [Centropristis striata]